MCGRFVRTSPPDEVAAWFGAAPPEVELGSSTNVAPTNDVDAVVVGAPGTAAEGERLLAAFRWGLVPSWAKDLKIGSRLINARAETVATKPAFRAAFQRRRCIVPADAFYEWERHPDDAKRKQPYLIRRVDGHPLAFAGLWERWRDPEDDDATPLRTCTIVTTDANRFMRRVHDRMPVVLPRDAWDAWLDPSNDDVESLTGLLAPAPEGLLEGHAVDPAVGKVSNRGPELVEPYVPDDDAFAPVLPPA